MMPGRDKLVGISGQSLGQDNLSSRDSAGKTDVRKPLIAFAILVATIGIGFVLRDSIVGQLLLALVINMVANYAVLLVIALFGGHFNLEQVFKASLILTAGTFGLLAFSVLATPLLLLGLPTVIGIAFAGFALFVYVLTYIGFSPVTSLIITLLLAVIPILVGFAAT